MTQAFLLSLWTVALAEIGDRTQLLCLLLTTRYRQPWPILLGVTVATVASLAAAAFIGVLIGQRLNPRVLDAAVGASMIVVGLWMLKPEKSAAQPSVQSRRGIFLTTALTFFAAEIGDKTQIATLALAAGFHNLPAVVAGSSAGMLLANGPVIFLGNWFAERLPLRAIHLATVALMLLVGALFLYRAARG